MNPEAGDSTGTSIMINGGRLEGRLDGRLDAHRDGRRDGRLDGRRDDRRDGRGKSTTPEMVPFRLRLRSHVY